MADSVTDHQAWGLGSYCFFSFNPDVVADRAISAPEASGVRFNHMVTVSLGGGTGSIDNIINDTGDSVGPGNEVVNLVSHP
ncbi:hypothetical protein DY218_20740 [Streptomyces triticagri]|uniref:Uncharacterized protein n=1 Tax=Streptomyces triticagri TaxID=2293568 RepID=A0A372M2I0_9ACTN|nr:hypothetical protein DY218_20740 [Streptomyces triticagri]